VGYVKGDGKVEFSMSDNRMDFSPRDHDHQGILLQRLQRFSDHPAPCADLSMGLTIGRIHEGMILDESDSVKDSTCFFTIPTAQLVSLSVPIYIGKTQVVRRGGIR
jgi:light-regulated signal transduction histidine kinase (bacteriophytochrome)